MRASTSVTTVKRENLVFERGVLGSALIDNRLTSISLECRSDQQSKSDRQKRADLRWPFTIWRSFSNDVDALTALYQRMHDLSFASPDADLGQARVATRADGTLVGIRKPLAAHEQPIMRTYLAVEDIQQAVKKAEDSGATIAYPPTRQGQWGHLCNRDPRRRATWTMATLGLSDT